jgi:hypothetical protein
MSYAKIISAVIVLGAFNMSATRKATSPDQTKTARIADSSKIEVSDCATGVVLTTLVTVNRYNRFGSVSFKDNETLIATVIGGMDEDHLQEKRVEYTIK